MPDSNVTDFQHFKDKQQLSRLQDVVGEIIKELVTDLMLHTSGPTPKGSKLKLIDSNPDGTKVSEPAPVVRKYVTLIDPKDK